MSEPLLDLLEEARHRGFLGPGPVGVQAAHAERLADLIGAAPTSFLDLGSGGGLPGLVLAQRWHETRGVLLDANRRRCDWLTEAVHGCGCADRVTVRCGRAEELARDGDLREAFPVVVARSFGPPSTTAECAVAFLAPEGALVVSEPPDEGVGVAERWPHDALADLGLSAPEPRRQGGVGAVVLRRVGPLDPQWPRRTGVPAKRPLWKPVATPPGR